MAQVKLNISALRDFLNKTETFEKVEREEMCKEALGAMAAQYLRVVKQNTPVAGGKRVELTESGYNHINAQEVKGKEFKQSTFRNLGGRTKLLKHIVRGRKGKGPRYMVLTSSEHMRRSWIAGEMTKKGRRFSIPVINTASYASFVNDGHRQKPGRFVPILGRRLVKNWVEGLHMTEKAEADLKKKSPRILQMVVDKHMKRGLT